MEILVLCPMSREYNSFEVALDNYRKPLKNHYKTVYCGVGKVNAGYTAALEISGGNYDLVVVVGYAAASHLYNQGDFVMPSGARYHDADVPEGLVPELTDLYDLQGNDDCVILTGDSFIHKDSALKIMEKFGKKVLFDMEATAVAQVCCDFDIPLLVMKFVSDIPTEDNNLQTFEEFVNTHTDFTRFVEALELF